MVKEVASPHLKICFDARLSTLWTRLAFARRERGRLTANHLALRRRIRPRSDGIKVKGDEKAVGEMLGLLDIGYKGYAGFELCHPLPVVNGKTVGLNFVDKNAQLAAEYMRGILAEAKKQRALIA